MATAEKYIQKVVDELVKHGYDAKRMEVTQGSDLLVRIIPLDYAEMEKELSHLRTTAELVGRCEELLSLISDTDPMPVGLTHVEVILDIKDHESICKILADIQKAKGE